MSSPVLATKLFPPVLRSRLVARARLVDQLNAGLDGHGRLTLVSAPAGFGKTTLLATWAENLPGRTRLGWLSLDEGDNASERFLRHVWAALADSGLALDPAAVDAVGAGSLAAAMTTVVNEAARAGREQPDTDRLLVLDDYHVITAPDVHEAMAFLLDHAPASLHLAVATRADPPLPVSRLRTRGQLTEIRVADLRFRRQEAVEFLNAVMGLQLSEHDVAALESRTEGWIAGLQLAALSLRGISEREDVGGFIDAFAGSHRFVIDYLMDEVLARQGAEVRDFLLSTSILDRLIGGLCDAVTGRDDGARMLSELDRRNVFLVPLDAERAWYRYHHLFGDVLRARLLAERPQQLPVLHLAASRWHEHHGPPEDAVRHALAAGDHDRAASLIEAALAQVRRARQDSLLLDWIGSLPEPVVRRSPVLSIVAAWSLLMTGQLAGMECRLQDAEAALAAGASDPALAASWADTEDLRTAPATIWVYRAALAQARGDVTGTMSAARRALELAGPDDHIVRGGAGGFLGLAAWAAGDVAAAITTFTAAARSLHAAGNLVDELDTAVVLGDMWVTAGRPQRARRLYEESLVTATAHGEPYPRATPDLHVGLAELDRERGDLSSAEAHLETAAGLRQRSSITESRHRWYAAMAQLRAAGGDRVAARNLLDEAEALYRPGFYPDVRPIPALRARLDIATGDLDAAQDWAVERELTTGDPVSFLREYEHLTLVRLVLARDRQLTRPRDEPARHQGELGGPFRKPAGLPGEPADALRERAGLPGEPADALRERAGLPREPAGLPREPAHHGQPAHDEPAGDGRPATLDDVLVLLARMSADAEGRRAGSMLEIGMLTALALDARGDRRQALAELDRALADAPEPDHFVSLFLDEGAPMLALLGDAGSSGDGASSGDADEFGVLRHHARRLLEVAASRSEPTEATPAAAGRVRDALVDPLSERELEVLRMLDSELTGPEIADRLFVSLNTLRTHTKRIFTKLAVTNRSAAVRRGRELHLL